MERASCGSPSSAPATSDPGTTWEEADQLEEIIEYTFEDADAERLQEASESRLLAQCKSAEDAELVLTMFNILQALIMPLAALFPCFLHFGAAFALPLRPTPMP